MATLLVLVEASPYGIHPASALSLCVARDLASERGATVVATTPPQTPAQDARVLQEVTRRGADRMVFCDAAQLVELLPSMGPKCILGPATPASRAQLQALAGDDLTIAWAQGPAEPPGELHGAIALMAGAIPWHELQAEIIPEYPGDNQLCDLREVEAASAPNHAPALRFVIDPAMDNPQLRAELSLLGASELSPSDPEDGRCIRICIGEQLPTNASAEQRWILIPGDPTPPIQGEWGLAHWVLPGTAYDALRSLHSQLWAPHLK